MKPMNVVAAALVAASVCTTARATELPFPAYLEGKNFISPPFLCDDMVPLVRDGATYDVRGCSIVLKDELGDLLPPVYEFAGEVDAGKYGMAGDAVSVTGITTTAGSTLFGGVSVPESYVGKIISVRGAGPGGAPFTTTIAAATRFSTAPTNTTNSSTYFGSGQAKVVSPGGADGQSYAPEDEITISGTSPISPTKLKVSYTTVKAVGATSATASADGPCVFTGSTGVGGFKFKAQGTVTGGVLTGPYTMQIGGTYTENPTSLNNEPIGRVEGCTGLTGTAHIWMGVYAVRRSQNGLTTTPPVGTLTQVSSTGAGTGATFTVPYTAAGSAIYGTDNADALDTIAALPGGPTIRVPTGNFLTSRCSEMRMASPISWRGAGRDASVITLVPECVFPADGTGWFTWFHLPSVPEVRDISFDLNHAVRNVLAPMAAPLFFQGTAGSINNVSIVHGTTLTSPIVLSTDGADISHFSVSNSYIQIEPDITRNYCMAQATFGGGAMLATKFINNICVGGGVQIDGDHPLAMGNDISGYAFGGGIFAIRSATSPIITGNQLHHGSPNTIDVNTTPSCGIENDAPGAVITSNNIFDNGGGGINNFGPNATITANTCNNNGKAKGTNSFLDFKLTHCVRAAWSAALPDGSATVTANVANDDGSGNQDYGFVEDFAAGLPSTLKANTFNGRIAPDNIKNPATTVDAHATMTVAGLKLPYVSPVLVRAFGANPSGTVSTANVMAGIAGSVTPQTTGRMKLKMCGNIRNSNAGEESIVQLRYGTGTAPANGAAVAGIAQGSGRVTTSAAAGAQNSFCDFVEVTGLTVGTAYWLDATFRSVVAGTTTLTNVDWWAEEF